MKPEHRDGTGLPTPSLLWPKPASGVKTRGFGNRYFAPCNLRNQVPREPILGFRNEGRLHPGDAKVENQSIAFSTAVRSISANLLVAKGVP
jgi:hypothetical protein